MNINEINNKNSLHKSINKIKYLFKNNLIKSIEDSFRKIDKDFADNLKSKYSLTELIEERV